MANDKKVSDKVFWKLLEENAGLCKRTADAIAKVTGLGYSRQAVHERANAQPKRLAEIRESNIDVAESGLHSLMRQKDLPAIRMRAIEFYLKTQGKHRGYTEQKDLTFMNVPTITIKYEGSPDKEQGEDILDG